MEMSSFNIFERKKALLNLRVGGEGVTYPSLTSLLALLSRVRQFRLNFFCSKRICF
jgi:hypothetical protein